LAVWKVEHLAVWKVVHLAVKMVVWLVSLTVYLSFDMLDLITAVKMVELTDDGLVQSLVLSLVVQLVVN